MKRVFDIRNIAAFLIFMLIAGAGVTSAQKRRPVLRKKTPVKRVVKPVEPLFLVPTSTVVRVRMDTELNSKRSRVGDTFTTTVTEPVYSSNGVVVIPVGSRIRGRVNSVTPAGKEGKPGNIDVAFSQVQLPNGYRRAINGSLSQLQAGDVSSDNEGTVSGKKMGHRKAVFIGGGAAGGALIGGAIGGGKGALIGAILGGGGGFLGDRFTKGPEAEVKAGTEFGVWLNQGISMPRFKESGPVNQ